MLQVREINDADELEDLRLPWRDLLGRTRQPSFFLSLDWLQVYWRHFHAGQRLRLLVVEDRRHPVGLVPLVVRSQSTRLGSHRALTFPLDHWGSFYGPIGRQPAVTLAAALGHVRDAPRDWDLIDLPWLAEGPVCHRCHAALDFVGLPAETLAQDQAALIELGPSWAEYWRSRGKRTRMTVQRAARRLGELGRLRFVRHRPLGTAFGDDDPRWDLFEDCLKVTRQSWQLDAVGTTLVHPRVADFLRELHAAATAQGAADTALLYLNGDPIAFAYGYHYRGHLEVMRIGYDQRVREGAGLVLMRRLLESSFELADHQVCLGLGYLNHKRRWATRLHEVRRVVHYPWQVRPQALRLARWIGQRWRGETSPLASASSMDEDADQTLPGSGQSSPAR